jgi:penicillin-binding protein 1A
MNGVAPMVDENGMPIGTPPGESGYPQQQPMVRPDGTGDPTQQELDQAFPPQQRPANSYPPRQPQPPPRQPQPPPPRQPDPLAPADSAEPRPHAA